MKKHSLLLLCLVLSAGLSTVSMAQTVTFTVNKAGAGSPNFTDLNACLSAINGATSDTYVVHFTDTSAAQYDLSPSETTMRDGIHLTFSPDVEGVVTVNGRLDVAQGGGTFAATGIHFMTTSNWVFLQGYDGQTYTRCAFGPGNDNGLVIRGGVNTVTDCAFTGVTNNAIIASGGVTNVNNCTWSTCGRCALGQNTGDTDPTHSLIINGGSATANQFGWAFVLTGFHVTVNDFTSTGFASAVTHDWETGSDGSSGWITFNNCQFTGIYDRAIAYYQNSPNSDNKGCTITLNNCLLENRADSGADMVVIDSRHNGDNGVVVLNGCTVRHLTPLNLASGLVVWDGGTLLANNTVIDGTANGVNCNSEGGSYLAFANLNHCVIVNTKTQAAVAADAVNTRLWIRNTIIDASNASGINSDATLSDMLVEHNLINASGTYDGTFAFAGNPEYVDSANGNYRTGPGSAGHHLGIPTDLLYDVDGNPYDSLRPDIGINQVVGESPAAARNWGLYF